MGASYSAKAIQDYLHDPTAHEREQERARRKAQEREAENERVRQWLARHERRARRARRARQEPIVAVIPLLQGAEDDIPLAATVALSDVTQDADQDILTLATPVPPPPPPPPPRVHYRFGHWRTTSPAPWFNRGNVPWEKCVDVLLATRKDTTDLSVFFNGIHWQSPLLQIANTLNTFTHLKRLSICGMESVSAEIAPRLTQFLGVLCFPHSLQSLLVNFFTPVPDFFKPDAQDPSPSCSVVTGSRLDNITELTLHGNYLSSIPDVVLNLIRSCPNVQEVDLEGCYFSEKTLQVVFDALCNVPTLRKLNVAYNKRLNDVDTLRALSRLLHHDTVTELCVRGCNLDAGTMRILAEMLTTLHVHTLNIDNNPGIVGGLRHFAPLLSSPDACLVQLHAGAPTGTNWRDREDCRIVMQAILTSPRAVICHNDTLCELQEYEQEERRRGRRGDDDFDF